MSGRTEFWLWSGSILGAVALHGGLAALLAGTAAQAAVPPPPLRVTISAMPGTDRVEDPVGAPLASAVPVQAVASAVPIEAATALAPQVPTPAQAIAAQDVTTSVAAPAAPPQTAASPAAPAMVAVDVAAISPVAVPAAAVAGAAAAGSTLTATLETPFVAAPLAPSQTTAAPAPAVVVPAAPGAPALSAATAAAPSLAFSPTNAPLAASPTPVALAAQSSASPPIASIASSDALAAAPGVVTSAADTVAVSTAPSAGAPVTAATRPQGQIGIGVAAAPVGSGPQVIAGEETVLVADTPDMPAVEAPVVSTVPTAEALSAFLTGYDGGNCFAARIDTVDQTATLSAYAVDFADSIALQLALGQSFDEPVDVAGYRAEQSQCSALAFVSRLQRLAGAPLALRLDTEQLADGEALTGTLAGPPDTAFHLFVVDDEGMVSDAAAYLEDGRTSAAFAIPVHLIGDAAAKLQLVIALAAEPDLLPPADRQPAEPFFAALTQRLIETGGPTAIAIAAFAVE